MLRGISPTISPELLEVLCSMGHSDTIVLGDANFPGESNARKLGAKYIRLDGQPMVPLLKAILELMPLDPYVENPALLMQKESCDANLELPIIDEYIELVKQWDDRGDQAVGYLPRAQFYETARNACCIVQTGETALYANIILQKGVVIA